MTYDPKCYNDETQIGAVTNGRRTQMKFTIEFNTRYYEMNHGRAPRGVGQWAFGETKDTPIEQVLWAHGSLTEAKREIKNRLAAMTPPPSGFIMLYVLP